MLKSLWGTGSSQGQSSEDNNKDDKDDKDDKKEETESDSNSAGAASSLSYWTKGLGGLMSSVGDYASSLKETVTTTVQTTVESTAILTEFDKEQKKFERERQREKDTTVPPWVGFNEEEQMKAQILELSADSRNVLRAPPPGIQFHFDFAKSYPVAMALLKEDARLQKLRFDLVPKKVKEEQFWLNYFYRVFLIKQSSQLASMATETKTESSVALVENLSDDPYSTTSNPSLDHSFTDMATQEHGNQDISEDFASDALVAGGEGEGAAISRESVQAELHQLGIKSTNNSISEQDVAGGDEEWAQLSRELEDLGLDEGEEDGEGGEAIGEEEWEQELNQMLEGQSHNDNS